jgi:hypothetical protein
MTHEEVRSPAVEEDLRPSHQDDMADFDRASPRGLLHETEIENLLNLLREHNGAFHPSIIGRRAH